MTPAKKTTRTMTKPVVRTRTTTKKKVSTTPKPKARKIQAYLAGILEDAVRYSHDRRPGRRSKGSK